MTTEQVGTFRAEYRCEACNMDFDSIESLLAHNVQRPPGTTPDAMQPDLGQGSRE
jgi:hypothetical protein